MHRLLLLTDQGLERWELYRTDSWVQESTRQIGKGFLKKLTENPGWKHPQRSPLKNPWFKSPDTCWPHPYVCPYSTWGCSSSLQPAVSNVPKPPGQGHMQTAPWQWWQPALTSAIPRNYLRVEQSKEVPGTAPENEHQITDFNTCTWCLLLVHSWEWHSSSAGQGGLESSLHWLWTQMLWVPSILSTKQDDSCMGCPELSSPEQQWPDHVEVSAARSNFDYWRG